MAVKSLTLTCDWCTEEYEDSRIEVAESLDDVQKRATESGWYVVHGPERELGGDGVRTYCSRDCMDSDL